MSSLIPSISAVVLSVAAAPAFGSVPTAPQPQIALAQAPASSATPARPAPRAVTRADVVRSSDAAFKRLDTDGNGTLSKSEIAAGQASAAAQLRANRMNRAQARFDALDTNGDKQLNFSEFQAAIAPVAARPEAADRAIAQLDSNKDGRVSAEEFRASRVSSFDRMDSDKNGTATVEEQRNAAQARRGRARN